jgi:hypothetical protein
MNDKIFDEIEFKNAIRGIVELAVDHAKAVKGYYDALIGEGFTPEQALRIVLSHGYMPPHHNGEK